MLNQGVDEQRSAVKDTASPHQEGLTVTVLVDYDNIKPIEERSTRDAADNLIQIREWVAKALVQIPLKAGEVILRIYGGWTDERGSITLRGNWVLASLSHVRGLVAGVRYLPYVPTSIAAKQLRLRGLYRVGRALPEQKMVDTLIAVDALHFCDAESQPLVIATDDDDIVPALLAISLKRDGACCLFRHRKRGDAINDDTLGNQKVRIVQFGT